MRRTSDLYELLIYRLFLRLGVLNRLLVLCQLSLICLPLVTYDASTPATVVGLMLMAQAIDQ